MLLVLVVLVRGWREMMKWCENSVLVTLEENIMDILLVATVCLLKKKKKTFSYFQDNYEGIIPSNFEILEVVALENNCKLQRDSLHIFFSFFFSLMIQANNPAISCSGTVKLQSIELNIFFILDKYLIFVFIF